MMDDSVCYWRCPNCGQLHFGDAPPDMCAFCRDFTTWQLIAGTHSLGSDLESVLNEPATPDTLQTPEDDSGDERHDPPTNHPHQRRLFD